MHDKLLVVQQLVTLRKGWKLPLKEVATRTGCSESALKRYEAGTKIPSLKMLVRWAEVFGYTFALRIKP